jgi:hypothetical protein
MHISDLVVQPSEDLLEVLLDGTRRRLLRVVKSRYFDLSGGIITEDTLKALVAKSTQQNVESEKLFSEDAAGC